jgi:hypothetical protein
LTKEAVQDYSFRIIPPIAKKPENLTLKEAEENFNVIGAI